jgi:peptidoglycan/xylan/chitin deacetylase (PgdA/CDA1 family)
MSLRLLFRVLSPAGRRARLSVLIFHRVRPAPDPLFPEELDAARFDRQLGLLKSWFHILPLPDAVAALHEGRLPARALAITFDDGYADNCSIALPILQRHAVAATFFIASAFLDGGRMWNDSVIESLRSCSSRMLDLRAIELGTHALGSDAERRVAIEQVLRSLKYLPLGERETKVEALAELCGSTLPDDLMLTGAQVLAMRDAGMSIGAHTMHHPILARQSDADAWHEIAECKRSLERLLAEPVTLFAYPNGKPCRDYLPAHVRMAREIGFVAAFSTAPGTAGAGEDRFEIPRFTPWDRAPARYGLRMAQNLARRDIATTERDCRNAASPLSSTN